MLVIVGLRPVAFEPALAEREKLMVDERERIAAAAVRLVDAADILMIGGGATTLESLAAMKPAFNV